MAPGCLGFFVVEFQGESEETPPNSWVSFGKTNVTLRYMYNSLNRRQVATGRPVRCLKFSTSAESRPVPRLADLLRFHRGYLATLLFLAFARHDIPSTEPAIYSPFGSGEF